MLWLQAFHWHPSTIQSNTNNSSNKHTVFSEVFSKCIHGRHQVDPNTHSSHREARPFPPAGRPGGPRRGGTWRNEVNCFWGHGGKGYNHRYNLYKHALKQVYMVYSYDVSIFLYCRTPVWILHISTYKSFASPCNPVWMISIKKWRIQQNWG